MIDYYDILDVSPNASDEVLKKAYHRMMQRYSPEQFHSRYRHVAAQRIQLIQDAYRTLSNPVDRRRYDVKLAQHTRLAPISTQSPTHRLLKILGIALLVFVGYRVLNALLLNGTLTTPVALVSISALVLLLLLWVFNRDRLKFPKRNP